MIRRILCNNFISIPGNRVIVSILFSLLFFININAAHATHAAGADLTYRCLGGLVYQVEATFYRDCGGTPEPGNLTITYKTAACSYSRTVVANKFTGTNGAEITMPCNSTPSSCNGGFTTGLRKWVYRATVTLPFACTDWVFSYRVCCRNCTVTTIQSPCASNSELYVEAKLNNIDAPCNNSPQFSNSPIAFVCLGQNFNYNQSVFDIDGDSLSYELITPKISASAEVSWLPPASQQTPLATSTPFTINALTGDINFTPSAIQIGILAVRVNEYRGGIFIGSTVRDMQVYTQNCFNTIPAASGIDGSANFSANVCAGQSLCFTLSTIDVDSTQVVSVNYNNIPNGATINEITGNRPSLQFCWNPTQADVSRIPKVFTVTVRDNACPFNGIQTFSYSILVGGPEITMTSTDPSCIGMNNGTATISGSGINGSTILWNTSPPQQSPVVTGLNPGNYSVIVTDNSGCSAQETVVINAPAISMTAQATGSGLITCQSGNIGTAQVLAIGGQDPFNYQWSNGYSTPNISGLNSGIYTVTITDANGCSAIDTVEIQGVSTNMSVNPIAVNDVICFGANTGSASLNITGGTAPYNLNWSNGAVGSSVQNLSAGNYSVTVTDVNGCTAITTFNIQQPLQPLTATVNAMSPVSCFGGSNGNIIVSSTGGTAPYNYAWSNGGITSSINNLPAGNYTLLVTDANGCTVSLSENIIETSSALNASIIASGNITCSGGSDGFIQLQTSGGVAPYTFQWSNGLTSANISGITAGNYTVIITDNNGCTSLLSQPLNEPELPITLLVSNVNHVVCGQGHGSINISSVGGTPPLQFLWNTGATTEDIDNLQPGFYTLTVTDSRGCSQQSTIEIESTGSAVIVDADHLQDVLCYNMSNGIISVNANGGEAPYTYLWNTGSSSNQLQNLQAGVYSLTVTDANGCIATSVFTINQPSAPLIPLITLEQNVTCYSGSDGELLLVVNGGTAPYNYLWSTGSFSQNLTGLGAGIYTVTVTDVNGCNAIISSQVSQPVNGLTGSISIINPVSCFGNSDGSASIDVQGGTQPYTFQWNNGSVSQLISGVTSGTYMVTVTDAMGCSYSETVNINQPLIDITIVGTTVLADCINNTGGGVNLSVSGGTAPYTYSWNNGQSGSNLQNVAPGVYIVSITDALGCTSEKSFTVNNNSQFNAIANGSLTICAGDMVTLVADSTSTGSYQWYFEGNILNGATGSFFSTPAAGSYTVSLTNSCGTFVSDTLEVIVKSIGNVSVSNAQIVCPPETATLIASGGATYNWSPVSYITFTNVPDPIVSPQTTTLYSVEITNEFGCKTTLNTNVAVICDSLLVPTGFSPNEDGVNDGYVIDGIEDYPGNKLWVYNRWGKLVYKATDYMNSWNGVSNISGLYMNKKVPKGTYYYILDLNDRSKPRAGYLIIRH